MERFDEKLNVDPGTGCWLWTAYRNPKGYGLFHPNHGETVLAYRWRWEQDHGPVPAGLVLDHFVCDTPACCNPAHLRPTTSGANTRRSPRTLASRNAAKTHCPKGHAYDEANTIYPKRGGRRCRACHNQRSPA